VERTILFADVRSFTTMSEARTPAECFAFLNRYLACVEPCVERQSGFVQQFYGDGWMAIFENADDALAAAVDVLHELTRFNEQEVASGNPPISVGIGIHTGRLMLGALGSEGRLEAGAISDAVNLAARLQELTKLYGARAVLSGVTRGKLRNSFPMRVLDRVQPRGRAEQVDVYELLEAGSPKLATAGTYACALSALRSGEKDLAVEALQACLEAVPADAAAKLQLERAGAPPEATVPPPGAAFSSRSRLRSRARSRLRTTPRRA
jgi:two-component system sensor histidine kinase ChiS